MHLSMHTALQQLLSQGKSLEAFPITDFVACAPSPCTGHYPGRLSTMGTPSPCVLRRVGDPQVPLHITSVRRFPVRPLSLWRRFLASLITALANSTLHRLGFKQFSLNPIQRSCLIFRPDFYRSCYCPLQVSHPGKTLL